MIVVGIAIIECWRCRTARAGRRLRIWTLRTLRPLRTLWPRKSRRSRRPRCELRVRLSQLLSECRQYRIGRDEGHLWSCTDTRRSNVNVRADRCSGNQTAVYEAADLKSAVGLAIHLLIGVDVARPSICATGAADGSANTKNRDRRIYIQAAGLGDESGDERESALYQRKMASVPRGRVRVKNKIGKRHPRIGGQIERGSIEKTDPDC